jgi:hypothetical protein
MGLRRAFVSAAIAGIAGAVATPLPSKPNGFTVAVGSKKYLFAATDAGAQAAWIAAVKAAAGGGAPAAPAPAPAAPTEAALAPGSQDPAAAAWLIELLRDRTSVV